MSRHLTSSLLWAVPGVFAAGLVLSHSSEAAKGRRSARPTTKRVVKAAPLRASATGQLPAPRRAAAKNLKPLPQYVSMETLETLRRLRNTSHGNMLLPDLQPFDLEKGALHAPMKDLLNPLGATPDPAAALPRVRKETSKQVSPRLSKSLNGKRLAQQFPNSVRPAPIPRQGGAIIPRYVRYPLEFQLCGIAIGTRAVDKDRFNRIDRYGLFALHGNPTAVVVPAAGGGTVTVQQQSPVYGTALFPDNENGQLPAWASAVTVALDNNHVEWLYKREGYSMGFVVDRLGYVDAIVAAGNTSPIARTQLEDPVHTVKLGDDLRKVLFRYGYPDTLETFNVAIAGASAGGAGGAGGAEGGAAAGGRGGLDTGGGAASPSPGSSRSGGAAAPSGAGSGTEGGGDAAGGAAGGGNSNGAFRTFEVRYEQSYNVVFSISNNRVVRIYIFGDPDFFNSRRRRNLRTAY